MSSGEGEGAGDDVAVVARIVKATVSYDVEYPVHARHAAVTVVVCDVVGLARVVRPAELDEVFSFAIVGRVVVCVGEEVVKGPDPGIPAVAHGGVLVDGASSCGYHLSEGYEDFVAHGVIFRLMSVSRELVRQFFQSVPAFTFVIRERDQRAGDTPLRARQKDESVACGIALFCSAYDRIK